MDDDYSILLPLWLQARELKWTKAITTIISLSREFCFKNLFGTRVFYDL